MTSRHLADLAQTSPGDGPTRKHTSHGRSLSLLSTLVVWLAMAAGCNDAQETAPQTDGQSTSTPDVGTADSPVEPSETDLGTEAETSLSPAAPDAPALEDADVTGDGSTTTVTFTTYINDICTEAPPKNSVVQLDTTEACNEAPKASISDLVCYADKITYTNHPNVTGCTSEGFFNTLPVGVCQEFPGPVATWKFIEPDTYNCLSATD